MMKVKYYTCPVCKKKFKTLNGWGSHMDTIHPDQRPEGYSTARFFYFVKTGKTQGRCKICGKPTGWNENSMKYDQYCKDPKCKKSYVDMAKKRMIGKYGKVHLLNDPEQQKKMLANRKISGQYKFQDGQKFDYVGHYEKNFLEMMDTLMEWHSNDLMAPSPHTYYYDYKNPKDKEHEGQKFYIPDFYIPSLNLEIEIKQQTSGNEAMNAINRVKEKLKDEVLLSNPNVHYLKLNDNNFEPFFDFLEKLKEGDDDIANESMMDLENINPAEEAYFATKEDILYNKAKFDSGVINLCFVTGHSGSGKSTMGRNFSEGNTRDGINWIDLDRVIENKDYITIEEMKQSNSLGMMYEFFTGVGKELYLCSGDELTFYVNSHKEFNYTEELIQRFVAFAKEYSRKHRDQKFIVEGIHLFLFIKPEELTNYAVYIKGTSAVTSAYRSLMRDLANNKEDLPKAWDKISFAFKVSRKKIMSMHDYENRVNDYRKYFKNIMDRDYVDIGFVAVESNNDMYQKYPIQKRYSVISSNHELNTCVTVKGVPYVMRARSEMMVIKNDEIFINFRRKGGYSFPGGTWNEGEDPMDAAIRETKEEIRVLTKDVSYCDTYIGRFDDIPKWVIEKIPEDQRWEGYYTMVYIGQYDGNYTGHIKAMDQDDMIKTGKFLKISEVYDILKSVHKKIIDQYFQSINTKEHIATEDSANDTLIDQEFQPVIESYLPEVVDNDAVMESIFTLFKSKEDVTDSWMSQIFGAKGLYGKPLHSFTGVKFSNHQIEIHGINYNLLKSRIQRYYVDKSIFNIFVPQYNAMSYKRFKRKKIQRSEIKIDYVYTEEFFALELVQMFTDLGKRFRDKNYCAMADAIYKNSWLAEADRKAETTELLDTSNLSHLSLTLNNYQEDFIAKYPKLKAQLNLKGYILAFEQGLGKTLTATGLSECLNVDHVYIVCPNSLKENWALEIRKYYTKYMEDEDLWRQEVFICSDKAIYFNENTTRFIITNNESISKMYPYVMNGKNMLILDESHNFRNLQSKRVQELLVLRDKLNCSDVLIMSGTPIKATPDEIVPALLMIDPTFTLKAATIFTKAFKLKDSLGTSIVQNRFGKIMYRKEKDVLENKLPEKVVENLTLSIKERDKYIMDNVTAVVMKRFSEIYDAGYTEFRALEKPFLSLSEKYSGTQVDYPLFKSLIIEMVKKNAELHEVDKTYIEESMKIIKSHIRDKKEQEYYSFLIKNYVRYRAHCLGVAFGEILPPYRRDMFISLYEENKQLIHDMITKNVKKTLIFTQFKGVAEYIYKSLNDFDIGAVMITGDVKNRMEILREFKENDSILVLIATSQTIGTGVTLTEANQMFFFGPPWRNADFEQCCDRIHRIGQTDECHIYTVILDTGGELNLSTRMDDILVWSRMMTQSVIIKTDDDKDIDQTNFENLLKAQESTIVSEFLSEPEVEQVTERQIISEEDFDQFITSREVYMRRIYTAIKPIAKDTIIFKDAVFKPVDGVPFAIKLSIFTKELLESKKEFLAYPPNIAFIDRREDDGTHWDAIACRDIKPGEELQYKPLSDNEKATFEEDMKLLM